MPLLDVTSAGSPSPGNFLLAAALCTIGTGAALKSRDISKPLVGGIKDGLSAEGLFCFPCTPRSSGTGPEPNAFGGGYDFPISAGECGKWLSPGAAGLCGNAASPGSAARKFEVWSGMGSTFLVPLKLDRSFSSMPVDATVAAVPVGGVP